MFVGIHLQLRINHLTNQRPQCANVCTEINTLVPN